MKETRNQYSWIESKQLWKRQFRYNGKLYAVYGHSKKLCDQKMHEKLNALQDEFLDNKNITLRTYYQKSFLVEQQKELKPSTLLYYSKQWKLIEPQLGSRTLQNISKTDIVVFQRNLASEHSANTVNRVMKFLRQIMNTAVKDRTLRHNPCDTVKNLKVTTTPAVQTIHRALSDEEVRAFLEYAEHNSIYYNLFRFMLNSGCRIGECLALTWHDFDYKKSEIRINKTVTRSSSTEYTVNSPKTMASIRNIPFTDTLKAIVADQKQRNSMLYNNPISANVFLNQRGETPTYNSINTCVASILKHIGVGHFSSHCFRDTFATRALESGMQPKTLQTILGHSSLATTMDIYAHCMPNTKMTEMSKVVVGC